MNLEDKIINKIKDEKISPTPFWYFLMKDYTLWGLVFISIILASISFAPIIFILQNLELGYVKHISDNISMFILMTLPYPWIVLSMLTTYLAMKSWEKTKHGYKFNGKKVFVGSLLASLSLGIILNYLSFGKMIDDEFRNVSRGNYTSFEDRRDKYWFDPETGKLIGQISNISTTSFTLENKKNNYSKEMYFDTTTLGVEHLYSNNNVRIIAYGDFTCAIFPDNMKPGNKNKEKKGDRDLQTMLASSSIDLDMNQTIHVECKNIFENGRAYFKPNPPKEKFLK